MLLWLRFVGAWLAPFLAGLAVAELLALTGATPSPPPAPVAPSEWPLDGPALGVLGGVLAAMVLALALARWLAARPDARLKRPDEPGAAVAIALTISLGSLLLWLLNPYALLAVPAAHCGCSRCSCAATEPARPPRDGGGRPASGTARDGLLPLSLSLDPLHGAWYLLMLVTGHSVGIAMSLAGCLLLARRAPRSRSPGACPGRRSRRRASARPLRPRRPRRPRLARRHGLGAAPLGVLEAGQALDRATRAEQQEPSPWVTLPTKLSAAAASTAARRAGGTVTSSS